MIEYEPNALGLADRYASVLGAVMDEHKEGKLKETIELQRKYYNKFYSWETRINEWRNFLNYARATKKTT
jgi:ribosomal protein L13E